MLRTNVEATNSMVGHRREVARLANIALQGNLDLPLGPSIALIEMTRVATLNPPAESAQLGPLPTAEPVSAEP